LRKPPLDSIAFFITSRLTPGRGDEDADAVHREAHQGEGQPLAELLILNRFEKGVGERHGVSWKAGF